jgi:hypothetical protein
MRPATGWFSYSLRNLKTEARTLRVTYFGGDKGRPFFILVNDQLPHKVTSNTNQRNELFDVDYPLPRRSAPVPSARRSLCNLWPNLALLPAESSTRGY